MTRIPPERARSMGEVRAAVDSIDAEIVALLAERMRFMDAAARIKPVREAVRDEARKAEVIARVKAIAVAHGLSPELVETLWEQLVEASIAHELATWDRLRRPARRHG